MPDTILSRDAIDAMPGLEKTHFLNADAQRTNKSLGDATGLTGFGIHLIDVPPGKWSTEYHRHFFEDECTYILSGTGVVTMDEQEFAVGPGDFIAYPKGGPGHTMQNTGTEVLRCLVVGERLAHDVSDYPRLAKRLFRNPDMPWNMVDIDSISEPEGGAK